MALLGGEDAATPHVEVMGLTGKQRSVTSPQRIEFEIIITVEGLTDKPQGIGSRIR